MPSVMLLLLQHFLYRFSPAVHQINSLKLVQICCNVATKFSICFCLFLSICSTMSTLFVLLSILFCSCDVSLLPLMFSNIFLKLKYSIKTVRKAIKISIFATLLYPHTCVLPLLRRTNGPRFQVGLN